MKILLIEGNEVDFQLHERILTQAYPEEAVVEWLPGPPDDFSVIDFTTYDICFVAQFLGPALGTDIIIQMREEGCGIPIILLTDSESEDLKRQAAQAGASDYMTQDQVSQQDLLKKTIHFAISQKKHERQLAKLSNLDGLTNLANRKKFDEALVNILESAERTHQAVGLFLIDIDDFKMVNDTWGHSVGDQLLQQISFRLRHTIRKRDIIARLAGDEFAVITMRDKLDADFNELVEKMLAIFQIPFILEDQKVKSTASFGVVIRHPGQDISVQEMMKHADGALYRSKDSGKNCFNIFDQGLNDKLMGEKIILAEFFTAFKSNHLDLYYQPIIDAKTSKITGVEALTRWQCDDGSFLSPAKFIPIVEKSGALIPVTEWGIEKVCAQIRQWHEQQIDLSISFNLSTGQLLHPATIDHIKRFIREYDIPEGRLKLELTESSLMEDEQLGLQCLKKLSEIGCPCAIDDFGIGYSSMSRLHKLPVSALKIDQSFVLNSLKDQKSSQICQIIILLAHKLGLKVIAEGIETFALVAYFKAIQCDMLQGYYYSHALPADQFIDWYNAYNFSMEVKQKSSFRSYSH